MFAWKAPSLTLLWLSVLAVAVLDYVTGYEIGMFAFYFIPVALGAWQGGRRAGFILALTCTTVWFVVDLATVHTYSREWYRYENAAIRGVAFLVVAILLSRIKDLVGKEREHAEREREHAAKQIKELQGLLPICASCKKIRDDQGNWEQIESYIAARSPTQFSHGLCPQCAERLYPDFYKAP